MGTSLPKLLLYAAVLGLAMILLGSVLLLVLLLLAPFGVLPVVTVLAVLHFCTGVACYWHSRRFGDDVRACTAAALMLGPTVLPLLFAHTRQQRLYRWRTQLVTFARDHRN